MKIPDPKKLPSGSWFIRLRLNGVSVPVTRSTRKECIQAAQLIKAEHRAGKREIRKIDQTPGQLIDAYVAKYEPVLSPSTIRGYDSIRKNRFQAVMDTPVSQIRDWQEVINQELANKSEHTVKNGWGAITAAFRDAGLPVPAVKLAPVPEHELPFLEPEEIEPFLAAVRDDPTEIYILLELHSLRESEAMAVVRNQSWDLQHKTIQVQGAIVPDKDHKYVCKQTNKTRKSTRTVPIMIPRLAELLEANGGAGFPEFSALTILKHVHAACERAGVTDVTNHGLRRTFASLGYSLGVSERIIMDVGGWENPATVHKVYIKLSARDKDRSKAAFTDFFSSFGEDHTKENALRDLAAWREKYQAKLGKEFKALFAEITRIEKENANKNANKNRKSQ